MARLTYRASAYEVQVPASTANIGPGFDCFGLALELRDRYIAQVLDEKTLDVDVVGGCNIKKFYGERALSVFIQPPSVEELRKRLVGRGTDTPEVIESRIAKAEYELSFAPKFDAVIVKDDLETAKAAALKVITQFLNQ